MSKLVADIEAILQQQVIEHRKMLAMVEKHQEAMKKFDLRVMEDVGHLTESCRMRITTLEYKRKTLTLQLAKSLKIAGDLKITQIADLYPAQKPALMKLRADLRELMDQITRKNFIASRVAGAVLGHLNTAVRLLAGAVEKAGLYTKQGVPKVSARIGMMEAIG